MSFFPRLIPNEEYAPFKDGVLKGWNKNTDDYWHPSEKQWRSLKGWTITQLPPPLVSFSPWNALDDNSAIAVYQEVAPLADIYLPIYGVGLYWNPRTARWVNAVAPGGSHGGGDHPARPCEPQMQIDLANLDKLHDAGTLHDDEWRSERIRVIHNCLGGG